jgi:hypothetical protein
MILGVSSLYSNLPFQIERLGTDYNGVIEINNRIIVYGNNGVLTYSDDFGDTWKQINLGEFNNILKIIKDENGLLYALAPTAILFSKDGGNSWTQKTILKNQTMLDFVLRNNVIYFITENSIGVIDKGLKTAPQIFLQFEDFSSFSKCELLDKYLFVIEADYYIYRINLETKQIDTIDVHTKVKMGSYLRDVSNIKTNGSDLYVLVANKLPSQLEAEYINIRHLVIKSTNYGNTWEGVTSDIPVTKDFLIENDSSVSTLAPICFYFGEKNPYFGVSFVRTKGKEFTEYIQRDTTGIWFPYYRGGKNINKHRISKIARIQDNLIVAVGNNKTILISKDNGANWEMKSFFRPIFEAALGQGYNIQVLQGDTIVVISNTIPFCFYSVDRGTTFLPISREQAVLVKSNFSFAWAPFSFSPGPFGLISFKPTERSNMSGTLILLYSNDLGKSFSKVESPIGYTIYNDSVSISIFHAGFLYKETNEFLISLVVMPRYNEYSGPRYVLCRFDDKLRLVDTTLFYFYVSTIFPYSEGLIFSDGTYLYKTSDYGKTMAPLSKFPRSSYYIDKNDYVSNIVLGAVKDNILIYEATPISGRLLKFNLTTNSFDSLPLVKLSSPYLITLNDTALITTESGIYVFPDIQNDFTSFDLVPLDYVATGRPLISNLITYGTSDLILTLELEDLAETIDMNTYTPLNLAIVRSERPYLRVEPEVEKDFVYLFAFPPYPNPAQNWVNVRVYWDSPDPSRDISIDLFDVYGRKFNLPINLHEESHNAIVSINTSTLGLGTYYLRINYGYKTIVYPVLIVR